MDKEKTIRQAKALREEDELEQSLELLEKLLGEYPDDPLVLFEVGGAYDVMGEENEAIPFYRQAIEAGLEDSDLQECLVCLGSSQRVVGNIQESVDTLEGAYENFPDNNSIRVFLALSYYSNEQYEEAVRTLLGLLLETSDDPDIQAYADTLEYYKDNLDEVWDE